ncbi:hypothetical protein PISMIDRAFT_450878 [Pisolithus microcarpus 441]|uniref:Unplaced genomic scaffold scaffold_40, whole genome shotgun sequence n=1 Tax=Pisolithus microcarpus 441 TaxID=765257 RepID=A0A0C9ZMN9_9AGAM|nr:hypothetical protein PISMIDRAFT_450878 [Pisolithus microcarpus 441]
MSLFGLHQLKLSSHRFYPGAYPSFGQRSTLKKFHLTSTYICPQCFGRFRHCILLRKDTNSGSSPREGLACVYATTSPDHSQSAALGASFSPPARRFAHSICIFEAAASALLRAPPIAHSSPTTPSRVPHRLGFYLTHQRGGRQKLRHHFRACMV